MGAFINSVVRHSTTHQVERCSPNCQTERPCAAPVETMGNHTLNACNEKKQSSAQRLELRTPRRYGPSTSRCLESRSFASSSARVCNSTSRAWAAAESAVACGNQSKLGGNGDRSEVGIRRNSATWVRTKKTPVLPGSDQPPERRASSGAPRTWSRSRPARRTSLQRK